MINKKALLNREPEEAGIKDAVHVAIVSLRAGKPIRPGEYIKLNADREAVPSSKKDSFGLASPFIDKHIGTGDLFWGLLHLNELRTVYHHWDHDLSFEPPAVPVKRNKWLLKYADQLKISYEDFMKACSEVVRNEKQTPYTGPLSEDEFDNIYIDEYEVWSEWSKETGYEFYNQGTECCPEYNYPKIPFYFKGSE
jgi:hypothetical protein